MKMDTSPMLYSLMMKAIRSEHTLGNYMGAIKLPLILTSTKLYTAAITQFYAITKALERRLSDPDKQYCPKDADLMKRLKSLNLCVTPGYESDIADLSGGDWKAKLEGALVKSTCEYIKNIDMATVTELVAAAFILYGALVVGGGKKTQARVKLVFKKCDHNLFNIHDDMPSIRKQFKETFNAIGKDFPELKEELLEHTKHFMKMNNAVIYEIQCLEPFVKVVISISAFYLFFLGVRVLLKK